VNVTFAHPERLALALAVLPALVFFLFRFRKLGTNLMPLVSRSGSDPIKTLSFALGFRSALYVASWIMLAIAASGPRWGSELVATRQEGSSILFVLDVSRSMEVTDVSPSRIAFASAYASMLESELADERFGIVRIGVVLAKGDAVLALPLTADHRAVLDILGSASPAMLSYKGSNPAKGILVALDSFSSASADSRTIILLTDGEQTTGSLDEAARAVRTSGATLVIVGVGTKVGSEIDAKPGDGESDTIRTVLCEDALRAAVRAAGRGSVYVTGTDRGSAKAVIEAVSVRSGKERKLSYSSKPVDRYGGFLVAAILLFCASCLSGGLAWRKK
jgi:Ca-activated chloride channel family protein